MSSRQRFPVEAVTHERAPLAEENKRMRASAPLPDARKTRPRSRRTIRSAPVPGGEGTAIRRRRRDVPPCSWDSSEPSRVRELVIVRCEDCFAPHPRREGARPPPGADTRPGQSRADLVEQHENPARAVCRMEARFPSPPMNVGHRTRLSLAKPRESRRRHETRTCAARKLPICANRQ